MTNQKIIQHFFHMGGYAFVVWSTYAIVLGALSGHWLLASRALRQIKKIVRCEHASKT